MQGSISWEKYEKCKWGKDSFVMHTYDFYFKKSVISLLLQLEIIKEKNQWADGGAMLVPSKSKMTK